MSYDSNNPFALILRGELPAVVVEEDEFTFTFMDIMPKASGHALIIPKQPASNIYEIEDDSLGRVIRQVKRVAHAAKVMYPDQGIRVIQLNDSEAGQSVFHLHFHVIPSSDGMNFAFHGSGQADLEQLKVIAQRYREALAEIE